MLPTTRPGINRLFFLPLPQAYGMYRCRTVDLGEPCFRNAIFSSSAVIVDFNFTGLLKTSLSATCTRYQYGRVFCSHTRTMPSAAMAWLHTRIGSPDGLEECGRISSTSADTKPYRVQVYLLRRFPKIMILVGMKRSGVHHSRDCLPSARTVACQALLSQAFVGDRSVQSRVMIMTARVINCR